MNIVGDMDRQVIESESFVKICIEANHSSQATFSITVTTFNGTAFGEYFILYTSHTIITFSYCAIILFNR